MSAGARPRVGEIVEARVHEVVDYGLWLQFADGTTCLVNVYYLNVYGEELDRFRKDDVVRALYALPTKVDGTGCATRLAWKNER